MFSLPADYIRNEEPEYYADHPQPPVNHQPDVYPYASRRLVGTFGTLVDVGCGSGAKLRSIIRPGKRYFGYDYGKNLALARGYDRHKRVTWRELDFDDPFRLEQAAVPEMEQACIVVCADVIEHLRNPQRFLMWLRQFRNAQFIFSTPDRALIYPLDHNGPPANRAHVQEWSEFEFSDFLVAHSYKILASVHTRSEDRPCSPLNTVMVHAV